jgi:hypothetical protein
MNQNPYEPPGQVAPPGYLPGAEGTATMNRGPFILAAIGAILASVYWAGLTLLIGFGVAFGSTSMAQIILPCVLIVLYAVRGYQLFMGDPLAARRILWLHGAGGVAAIVQMATGTPLLVVLQGIKLLIHVFGGVTAYMAQRSFAAGQTARM